MNTSESEIRGRFESCGTIIYICVHQNFAFITFEDADDAEATAVHDESLIGNNSI
jgi:hypothetical protein